MEVARHVMKMKGYSRDTIGSLQMQEDIMEAHLILEEESKIYRRLLGEMDISYYEIGREAMFLAERVGIIMGLARL